jgi:zinc protease
MHLKYIVIVIMTLVSYRLSPADTENIGFEEFDLPNGLHVIMHKDNSNPLVSVDIWYHVGSKNEDTNHTGFAHLFEHMMFQGSANVGKAEHFTYIQKAGGTLNGTTNQDRTNYFETVPSNALELVLWLESDRMGTLNVTQENFDNQREVVKEEKRQRYDNVPYGSRYYNLFSNAYKGTEYGWIPIGSMKDLNNASLSYAQSFYKRFYAPDNAVLVIAGDIDYEKTKELVKKYFSGLKPSGIKKEKFPKNSYNMGEITDTVYDNVQLPALYIGYKVPGLKTKDAYTLNLLASILSDGRSSRLYQDLVYKNKIAKSAFSFDWDLELGGLFVVSATGLQNSSLNDIENHIDKMIDEVKSDSITGPELEKAKNKAETNFINRQQTMRGIADQLAYYWTYFRNTGMINTDIQNYEDVTLDDINTAAEKYLNNDNRVVIYYLPEKK